MSAVSAKRLLREVDIATSAPIVAASDWARSVPGWLNNAVLPARLKSIVSDRWELATDEEVMIYLFTASLVAPIGSQWTDIHLWTCGRLLPQAHDVLDIKDLTPDEERMLEELRRDIRRGTTRRSFRKDSALKIILTTDNGRVYVAIGGNGKNPVLYKPGSLEEALQSLPGLVSGFVEEGQE